MVEHARATRPSYLDKLVRSNVLRHYPAICPTFDQGLEICYTETDRHRHAYMDKTDYIVRLP